MLTELDRQITRATRFNGLGTAVISTTAALSAPVTPSAIRLCQGPGLTAVTAENAAPGHRLFTWDRASRDSHSWRLQFPAAFALPPFLWCATADSAPQQALRRAATGDRGGTGRGAHWDGESGRSRVVAARAGGGALTWRLRPGRVPPLPPPALLAGKMAAVRRARRDSRCVVRFSDRELC